MSFVVYVYVCVRVCVCVCVHVCDVFMEREAAGVLSKSYEDLF